MICDGQGQCMLCGRRRKGSIGPTNKLHWGRRRISKRADKLKRTHTYHSERLQIRNTNKMCGCKCKRWTSMGKAEDPKAIAEGNSKTNKQTQSECTLNDSQLEIERA